MKRTGDFLVGEQIPFPSPYERFLQLADKAFFQKEFLQAKNLYEKAYELQKSYKVNYRLVGCLEKLHEFSQALEAAEDFLSGYLQDDKGYQRYGRLLILSGQYLIAYHWLELGRAEGRNPETLESFEKELKKLEEVQEIFEADLFSEKQQQLKLFDIQNKPMSVPQWQSFIQKMTRKQFIELMQEFLPTADNFFLIPRFMEELVRLKVEEVITVRDINKKQHALIPKELPLLQESESLRLMIEEINETLGQKNPVLAEQVLAELKGHAALSYPFIPAVFEARHWAQSYVVEYTKELIPAEFEAVQQKKAQLRRLLKKIF